MSRRPSSQQEPKPTTRNDKLVDTRRHRRRLGEHLTPTSVFEEYILPAVQPILRDYLWVDLFAGAGNLVLPLLQCVPREERAAFFEQHIRLYDIQPTMVERAVQTAVQMHIPESLARQNIRQRDTLADYPSEILRAGLPVYHITNPPYLYLGYIAKHPETQHYLPLFEEANRGYQDLYQIALMNDLRSKIQRMIYIIPSNFLFGASISNKFRDDFLPYYRITRAVILERDVFEHTGVHVAVCFFERKPFPEKATQHFEAIKLNSNKSRRVYCLEPRHHYRAGSEFETFVQRARASRPLTVKFYLMMDEVQNCSGEYRLTLVDANGYDGSEYRRIEVNVSESLYQKVKRNPLFIRTLDTGSLDGRAGLYFIADEFQGADGIVVTKATFRTHPIQLFITPALSLEETQILRNYFNLLLEYWRSQTDSEFMTTYKYSESRYTRKYLGLSQAKALIETFPWRALSPNQRDWLARAVAAGDAEAIVEFLTNSFPLTRNF